MRGHGISSVIRIRIEECWVSGQGASDEETAAVGWAGECPARPAHPAPPCSRDRRSKVSHLGRSTLGANPARISSPRLGLSGPGLRVILRRPSLRMSCGLGLSIWQLYTWRIPHEGIAGCGMELKDRRTIGGTLDMAEVDDEEARGMITKLLRTGGARICVHTVFTDCPCCSNCTYRNRKPVLSLPSAVGNHLAAVDWVPPLRSALGTSPPKLPTCQVRQQPTYQVDPLASQVINPSLDPDWACLAYEGQCLVLMHEGDGRGT